MGNTAEIHMIGDVEGLAAMTHPLRRRLIDLLDLEGPVTVAALAARIGLPDAVIAGHLAILAASGLAQEEPAPNADGSRPRWRLPSETISVMTNNLPDDPVSKVVIGAAHSLTLDRLVGFMRQWMTIREGYSEEWAASGFMIDSWLRLTPAELTELRGEINDLMVRWSQRCRIDDGQDRQPVLAAAQAVRVLP